MEYRLCDPDRERFGCDEWVPYSAWAISVADLEELSARFGFEPSDWPTVLFGELTLEQAGDPDAKPVPPPWQMRAVVWQILRQNGHDVSWEDAGSVRFGLVRVREEGKDPGPSTGSATSTTPRSKSSSISKRRRSTPSPG